MSEKSKWFVNKILDYIYKIPTLSSTKKSILICLAYHANQKGECWPSYRTISDETGFGRKPVQRLIYELEVDGYLMIKERFVIGKERDSNFYKLYLKKFREKSDEVGIVSPHVGIVSPHGGDLRSPQVGIYDSTDYIEQPQLNYPKGTTQDSVDFFIEETEQTKEVENFIHEVFGNGLFGDH